MADEPISLASLSLTHVYYVRLSSPLPSRNFTAFRALLTLPPPSPLLQDPADPVSYVCAWLALVPQALIVVYVTLVWSTREAEVCLALAGQLACEAVNFALKRLIKEERPQQHHYGGSLLASLLGGCWIDDKAEAAAATRLLPVRRGYGMPSSHAQFAGYWALTIALFLLVRSAGRKPQRPAGSSGSGGSSSGSSSNNSSRLTTAQRYALSAVAFVVAVLIAWSRVYLHYHTPRQVLAGFTAGLAIGAGWFGATAVVRQTGLLQWALQLPPAQYLRLRDLAPEEDALQAGWERWQARQAAAAAAKNK